MTDPIADMLTRIRNASVVRKEYVIIPYSTIKFKIAEILSKEGYVGTVEKVDTDTFSEIKVQLKYEGNKSVIRSIKRVSKPGRRVYSKNYSLPTILNGLGLAIVSTSKGLMTNKDAKREKIGGEILCEIY